MVLAELVVVSRPPNGPFWGKFLPGTRIPIHHPDRLREARPDYVMILPWNLRSEILAQLAFIREWGGRFIIPIPEATVYV